MKPLDEQLQLTIKSLILSIRDGMSDFGHRAFHINQFLNYLEYECFIGYSNIKYKDDLMMCIPRLENLLKNISAMKDDINHDCLYKWHFERAKKYLKRLNYRYLPYDTGLETA